MGQSYSKYPPVTSGPPTQRPWYEEACTNIQNDSLDRFTLFLVKKVPNYFIIPPRHPSVPWPLPPPKAVSKNAPRPPPVPSLQYLHPLADLLRRYLFIHVFSEEMRSPRRAVEARRLFVKGEEGEEGKLKVAYVKVMDVGRKMKKGTSEKKGPDDKGMMMDLDDGKKKEQEKGEEEESEFSELHIAIPYLTKLRITIKTGLTISTAPATHAHHKVPTPLFTSHENIRIMEMRAEITGFDRNNQVVRPPGVLGIGAKLFVEEEKEMGKLVERVGWDWLVEQLKELCKALLGEDGGLWDFAEGGFEDFDCEVEGEGFIRCFVVREGDMWG